MQKLKLRLRSSIWVSCLLLWACSSGAVAQDSFSMRAPLTLPVKDPYCHTGEGGVYENLPASSGVDTSMFSSNANLCSPISLIDSGGDPLSSVPNTVVDWVLLELRATERDDSPSADDAGVSKIVARKPAFLLTNGRIVDAQLYVDLGSEAQTPSSCSGLTEHNSCPDVVFDQGDIDFTNKDIYLVIRHRSHLDIMSSSSLTPTTAGECPSGVCEYDFTGPATQTVGGAGGIKDGNVGINNRNTRGMFEGDTNYDQGIGPGDYPIISNAFGSSGVYSRADTDYDTNVGPGDYPRVSKNFGGSSKVVTAN